MGIYYAAVDNKKGQYFEPPEGFSNKIPGIYHPVNPFGPMLVMMNSRGDRFEIENDAHWVCYYDKGYEDITEKVYEDFKKVFNGH